MYIYMNHFAVQQKLTHCKVCCCFFFFFGHFKVIPEAYESSQARNGIGAEAALLHHSHRNARSEPHPQLTPQLTATLYP